MASLNDFKILNNKCSSYFHILKNELAINIIARNPTDENRIGFYIYMLECICNIKDPIEINELITDTEYNLTVNNIKINDCGVDAVYIDENNHSINLFNFKFRESFNPDDQQSANASFITTKFTNALLNRDINHLEGKLKKFAKKILEVLSSNDVWSMKLYLISN